MNEINARDIAALLRQEADNIRANNAVEDQQWVAGGLVSQADVAADREQHDNLLACADWLDRHDPARYTRLALRTSHLLGLFRDHALSFDHHDGAMLSLGCRLLDDIESILHDINGRGTQPASYVEGLERFAHSLLLPDAAHTTTAAQRDAARRALGLPAAETIRQAA